MKSDTTENVLNLQNWSFMIIITKVRDVVNEHLLSTLKNEKKISRNLKAIILFNKYENYVTYSQRSLKGRIIFSCVRLDFK